MWVLNFARGFRSESYVLVGIFEFPKHSSEKRGRTQFETSEHVRNKKRKARIMHTVNENLISSAGFACL